MSQMIPDRIDIENLVIGNLRILRDELDKAQRFYEYFGRLDVSGLVELGFSAEEAEDLKNAYGNLSELRDVTNGAAPTGTKDYFFLARKFWGLS